jgi:hypothetical protein
MEDWIDPGLLDLFRTTGVFWLIALLTIGGMIYFSRAFINWQLRRIERIAREKEAEGAGQNKPGSKPESP